MTPWQCRTARLSMGFSRTELADRSGLGLQTINKVEAGMNVWPATLEKIEQYFIKQGIEFKETKTHLGVMVPKE